MKKCTVYSINNNENYRAANSMEGKQQFFLTTFIELKNNSFLNAIGQINFPFFCVKSFFI